MKDHSIINLGIVAHVDAGKTTLTEQLLFRAGEVRSRGNVDEGTAHTDWLSVERARGISVKASSARISRGDRHINLIDTPGHVDFISEVERSLSILDAAILVISSVEGIQSQTELLLDVLVETKTPTLLLINKIDRIGSDTDRVVAELLSRFANSAIPFQTVLKQGGRDCAIRKLEESDSDFLEECVLALADADPDLLDEHLSDKPLPAGRLETALGTAIRQSRVLPILYASTSLGIGVDEILDFIFKHMQSPPGTKDDDLSAIVYKIEHDQRVGRIAHVRLYGGTIKSRDNLQIPGRDPTQKVSQVRRMFGGRHEDIGAVHAGDIAALCGLSSVQIGDVIGKRGGWNDYRLAVPLLKVQVLPENIGDLSRLIPALRELCDEDPQLDMDHLVDEREIHIRISGAIQQEVLTALLKERYGLDVAFSKPLVIYKETPAAAGEGTASYTMPKPCWAVVRLWIEPGPPGSGLVFDSTVLHDDIFPRYQHHVQTSVKETLRQGLSGWEVTDLRVTLTGGNHHLIHTHPLDFFVATPMAVLNGLTVTGTTLLEPVVLLRISAPSESMGKILSDLVQMRGSFESPVLHEDHFIVEAQVPVATSLDYSIRLGIVTSGRATIGTRFAGYRPCPPGLGATTPRRSVDPLDRSKWILHKRNAIG